MQNQRRSILVVEDDPEISELLREALAERYAAECVGNVAAALARLTERAPDVILMDCQLPGGDAMDVVDKARNIACPMVLTSGLPEVLEALSVFGHPCLPKPFRIGQLMAAIEAAVSRNGK
ncbi:MAG TPA: response regulator [Acetobacteraceae bacterium]|nr:response regulator [Acetobacteraceae bacterium]